MVVYIIPMLPRVGSKFERFPGRKTENLVALQFWNSVPVYPVCAASRFNDTIEEEMEMVPTVTASEVHCSIIKGRLCVIFRVRI